MKQHPHEPLYVMRNVTLGRKGISHKTATEAFETLLPALKRHLESDHDTAQAMTRPGAWKALESYYRETFSNMVYINELRKRLNIKVRQEMPDGRTIEREAIGATFFTSLRRINRSAVRMYHGMRDTGWMGTDKDPVTGKPDPRLNAKDIEAQYDGKSPDLAQRIAKRFTPEVWRKFVQPLTHMEGRSAFYAPGQTDGIRRMELQGNVRKAFEGTNGDAIKFAENLYALERAKNTSETKGEFVGRTLQAFQEFFDSIHGTQKDFDDSVRKGIPTPPRLMQDARISESWPGEWLDYQTYGRYEMHQMTNMLATQSAFGRDTMGMEQDLQSTVGELTRKRDELEGIAEDVKDANPEKKGRALQSLISEECKKRGENYLDLSQAQRNLQMVKNEYDQFRALMKVQGGLAMELRPFLEAVNTIAGMTVQGQGTALVHLGNFGQQFMKFGLGPTGFKVLQRIACSLLSEHVGSFAQLFQQQIAWNADRNARRVRNGFVDSDDRRKLKDTLAGFTHDPTSTTNPAAWAIFTLSREG